MSSLILWMDTKEAKIFYLKPEGVERERFHQRGPRHPVETDGRNHPIEQTDEEKFYHTLCQRLEKVQENEWLLTGPGPAREHFINHVEKHHPQLKNKIRGTRKMEKLSDDQIIAEGRKFFKHEHVFDSI